MADHVVQPGDCFSSVAKDNGYYNYRTLYDHPENATLKGNRPNPNMLIRGDIVKVPAKRQKKLALDLDKEKKFVVDRKKTKIRIAVKDVEDKAPKVSRCSLSVGSASLGKLPSSGLLEMEVDASEKSGTLALKMDAPPKPDTGQSGPGVVQKVKDALTPEKAPPHPPDIVLYEFTDELDPASKEPVDIEVDLELGSLEPHGEVRGGLQRLNNLGCTVPNADATTADDDATKRVVKSYQTLKGDKTPSGRIQDILGSLETAHDKV